ncbi:MAG: porphobilinogen synthase [Crenarchaeota archaeon]|nr:porphobilinogen synthase [Thermoproteota archaeon]
MLGEYPLVRPRRLRKNELIRDLVAETEINVRKLIMPIFVKENIDRPEEIESMPGQFRWPLNDDLLRFVEDCYEKGLRNFIIFGIPSRKDPIGSEAFSRDGIVQRCVRALRETFGEKILIITDLCLCQYTDHGHCGIVKIGRRGPYVDNDDTLKIYAKIAVAQAEAGADIVAPSGMMDGQVRAIREALDREGYSDVLIMSYSVKYASSFYGPFREAAYSSPRFGDRRTYQMDPRNTYEALKEVELDLREGADIVMVKPALAYLDVIRLVKTYYPQVPLAAYNVSGEYSMVKAAARMGWIDEKMVTIEILTAIFRAGADMVITYHAREAAELLH